MELSRSKSKVFCVGAGKTGTTSMNDFFLNLGYEVGAQDQGELLLRTWARRDFAPIVALARTADFFQDLPFNCPGTFQAMDAAFPGSKFILTWREPDDWYRSLTAFHTAIVGKERLPTKDDLQVFSYRYRGWILEALELMYGVSPDDPYNRDVLLRFYDRYNQSVRDYFTHRPESLLVVDVSAPGAAREIVEFIGERYDGQQMPHLNRTRDAAPIELPSPWAQANR